MQQRNQSFSFLNTMFNDITQNIHPSRTLNQEDALDLTGHPLGAMPIRFDDNEDYEYFPINEVIEPQPLQMLRTPSRSRGRMLLYRSRTPPIQPRRVIPTSHYTRLTPRDIGQQLLRSLVTDLVYDRQFDRDTARALLLSSSEESKMQPASEEKIKSIETFKYKIDSEQTTCTVCLEDFKENDDVKKLPKCKHYFHSKCIDQWLQKGDARCPNCNNRIDDD